ncbi:acyl-CoA dehydrogenase, partial [Streptomyces sp. FT05W]
MSTVHAFPRSLSEEQRAFVTALRDFARRECGTREQRDALAAEAGGPHA